MQHVNAQPESALTVDIEAQEVRAGNHRFAYQVEPFRKHCLINGLDDIGLTLQQAPSIDAFEATQRLEKPWLYTAV